MKNEVTTVLATHQSLSLKLHFYSHCYLGRSCCVKGSSSLARKQFASRLTGKLVSLGSQCFTKWFLPCTHILIPAAVAHPGNSHRVNTVRETFSKDPGCVLGMLMAHLKTASLLVWLYGLGIVKWFRHVVYFCSARLWMKVVFVAVVVWKLWQCRICSRGWRRGDTLFKLYNFSLFFL